jgi:tetratricopeptide (TPR) repeat protein
LLYLKTYRSVDPVNTSFKSVFYLILFGFVFLSIGLKAQSAKEFYKNGLSSQKKGFYKEAIGYFTSAINLKADYTDAYFERGNSNFKLKQFELALPDYIYLHRMAPKNESYIIKASLAYMELKRWSDAQSMLLKLEADDINLHVAEAKVRMAKCKIMLKNYEEAVQYLSESISIFADDDQIFYYKGIASDSLKDYQTAVICYNKSLEIIDQKLQKKSINSSTCDSLKSIYLVNLGNSQLNIFDFNSSKDSYTKAIKLNPINAELYLIRGSINLQNNQLNEALADLKSCEELNYKSYAYYYTKAKVLKKAGQFNQAIENLEPIILSDTAFHARLLKGQCLESIGKFEEAQQAYKRANIKVPLAKRNEMDASLKRIRNRVYELKRETDPPLFAITSPSLDLDKKMMIPKSHQFAEVQGNVTDQSLIKSIVINELEADFEKDSLNPHFRVKINLSEKTLIKVKIVDIYLNTTEQNFEFNRSEKNIPKHKLYIDYAETKREIYIDKSRTKTVKISGRVEDESAIKRIMINDKTASFNINETNPSFEANIDVSHLDSIKILIIDEYDNIHLSSYFINSKLAAEISKNPMGKTWLVFIANSNYENHSTLSGPEKDLNLMRSALLQYKFDNVITKHNMTLNDMEKFFRIELRDLIKEQGVNSIMIWFAGHGKYINETGYWLPVNAKKDDEISYYPIPYLRSNLNSYGKTLRNILIVSDACESGPAFSLSDEKVVDFDCKLLDSNNSSAFVFSSTTYEKASDNSVFCETFADLLSTNNENCLSMSTVVNLVSTVVEKRQSQRCKYGKIKDMNNQTGNFYFLKREK